jgi:hypothetical protein
MPSTATIAFSAEVCFMYFKYISGMVFVDRYCVFTWCR